jgi:small subunit ribosomal protein S16
MAIKIRLARAGTKKRPFYHIVVADKEKPRDGRFMERIGIYDPSRPITEARIDRERLAYWESVGAQISPRAPRGVHRPRSRGRGRTHCKFVSVRAL